MTATRFDRFTRGVARRFDRRAASLLLPGLSATTVTAQAACQSVGAPCRSAAGGASCCAGLTCDRDRKVCLGRRGAAGCYRTAECVDGLLCVAGVCREPAPNVCRAIARSCNPAVVGGRCCGRMRCDRRVGFCRGLNGATGCTDDRHCAPPRVCVEGVCRQPAV
jgi:hypothetical protein